MTEYFDINNRAIRTGDLVRISNAYNKSSNGIFIVTRTPGDPSWRGNYLSLLKVTNAGIPSTAKYRVNDWPIHSYVNGREKRAIADGWNAHNATIEVLRKTPTQRENLVRYFRDAETIHHNMAEDYALRFGESSNLTTEELTLTAHLRTVAESIENEPTA